MKIAAIGDVHCRQDTADIVRQLLGEIENEAQVLLLCGDMTDTGLPEEAEILSAQLVELTIPVIGILGNHDHESGKADEVAKILRDGGVTILDNTIYEVENVGFVGTKGFCGGFGQNLVQPFGELALKTFIRTSIDEALNLENSLARLAHCEHKVAMLHYSPIKETLQGEPQELWPFLGSSRLCDALERQSVDVIFHGHAHHGSPSGKTQSGTPVFNVCRFVLNQYNERPYCLVEV